MKKSFRYCVLVLIMFLASLWLLGCNEAQPTEQPTAQPTPQPTTPPELPPNPTPLPSVTPASAAVENYQTPGDHIVRITVDGTERMFILHVPPGYQSGVPTPLVLNVHAYSSTAMGQERLSRMFAKADEEGFIVVNPQALGEPTVWQGAAYGPPGQADMDYFEEMFTFLQRELSIEPDRIYATGMSNGATMVNRLGCDMSAIFAAIAPVSGAHALYDLCRLDRPVSVLVLHGTEDSTIPYHGDDTGIPSVHSWVEAWAKRNSCALGPSVSHPHSTVTQETWENCRGDVVVSLYSIKGGRHDWPGSGFGPGPWPEGMAPDIYANDVIWDFFKTHARSPTSTTTASVEPTITLAPQPSGKYQEPGDFMGALQVEGYDRRFTVHIPPGYQPGVPLPLVINLHAYTHSVFQQEELSQMNAKADKEGFVVVNPQAQGNPPAWWGYLPGLPGQIDKSFFVELLAHLQQEISIDPARIYATGLSDGGTMANALACEMSDTIAAIASVAGSHADLNTCVVNHPVSVLAIHGTADPIVPYDGRGNEIPPVHLWVEAWAQRNRCDFTPSVEHPGDDITVETWGNCDENTAVALYSRKGGDHIWPGSEFGEQLEGKGANMNATDVIWEFFEAHPKAAAVLPVATPSPTAATPANKVAEPVAGSDGREIVFSSQRDRNWEIYILTVPDETDAADGEQGAHNQRRLTNNPARDDSPDWSPDGTQIAFTSTRDGNSEIYVMAISDETDADSSDQRRLTSTPEDELYPDWSPDGTQIAFTIERDGHTDIYVIEILDGTTADGSNYRRLTDNDTDDWEPAWSPDGTQIAFISNRDGNDEIYVMAVSDETDADGSDQRRLTNNPGWDYDPAWSPDGTQLAFTSQRDGSYLDLYVMDISDGLETGDNKLWRLTHSKYSYEHFPTWSPDGSQLAFMANDEGNFEIYVMDVSDADNVEQDYLDRQRLTNIPADDYSPDWRPQPKDRSRSE